jgi:hypothetical protein
MNGNRLRIEKKRVLLRRGFLSGRGAELPVAVGSHADQHRLLADHLTAEYRVRTEGRGRSVDEWKMRPERADNHGLDCLVGSAVAASMLGAELLGIVTSAGQKDSCQFRRVTKASALRTECGGLGRRVH